MVATIGIRRKLAAGITDMDAANIYLKDKYMPAFNQEFSIEPALETNAFVQWFGYSLDDILCEQFERTVTKDNIARFKERTLQIPGDEYRHHYVKTKVRIHQYIDGHLAIFPGPRKFAEFGPIKPVKPSKPERP